MKNREDLHRLLLKTRYRCAPERFRKVLVQRCWRSTDKKISFRPADANVKQELLMWSSTGRLGINIKKTLIKARLTEQLSSLILFFYVVDLSHLIHADPFELVPWKGKTTSTSSFRHRIWLIFVTPCNAVTAKGRNVSMVSTGADTSFLLLFAFRWPPSKCIAISINNVYAYIIERQLQFICGSLS